MVAVVGARVGDIVQHVVRVQAVLLRHRHQTLRPERALSVDVESLAGAATLLQAQLARDAQGVAELRLASSELAKDFGDAATTRQDREKKRRERERGIRAE